MGYLSTDKKKITTKTFAEMKQAGEKVTMLTAYFITEYRGAELGTIALLANIIREMLTLLGAPLMARWFGPLAPISAGGATTMDTTLPILSQTVGQRYIALSIYHGFVVDFTVPFLVSWWCMV